MFHYFVSRHAWINDGIILLYVVIYFFRLIKLCIISISCHSRIQILQYNMLYIMKRWLYTGLLSFILIFQFDLFQQVTMYKKYPVNQRFNGVLEFQCCSVHIQRINLMVVNNVQIIGKLVHVIHGHFFVFILEENWESLRYFHHYIHLYLPVDTSSRCLSKPWAWKELQIRRGNTDVKDIFYLEGSQHMFM